MHMFTGLEEQALTELAGAGAKQRQRLIPPLGGDAA
jgi:hypothetical protein